MKKYVLTIIVMLTALYGVVGQTKIKELVDNARANGKAKKYSLFTFNANTTNLVANDIEKKVFKKGANHTYLKHDKKAFDDIVNDKPAFLELSVPINQKESLDLELVPANIFASDFKLTTNEGDEIPYTKGVFYHGIVKGSKKSVVAISFVGDEISGIVSDSLGNRAIGKQKSGVDDDYIFYNENSLDTTFKFDCGTSEIQNPSGGKLKGTEKLTNAQNNIVKVYFECDYQMYLDKGSNKTNVGDYVASVFNQVALLYQNESITVQISEIYVHGTLDPYSNMNTTALVLTEFQRRLNGNFNGNIAQFLSTRNIDGGRAYLDQLCNKNIAVSVSGIYNIFSPISTYSWTVYVVTHELGHILGSPHTQSCTWVGGAIDNCAQVEDGTCNLGPTPINGGTIMSYCHIYPNNGINFSNGFGQQPGNLIRNRVNNATCLGGGNCANPPTNDNCIGAVNINLVNGSTVSATSGTSIGCATQSIPPISCNTFNSAAAMDVWHKIIAVGAGNYIFTLTPQASNQGWDAVFALYLGDPCSGGSLVACGDPAGSNNNAPVTVNFNIASNNANSTYYLRVYDFGNANTQPGNPNFSLSVTSPSASGLVAPVAGASSSETQSWFTANWGYVNNATSYFLQASTTSNFSNLVASLNVGNVNRYTLNSLICSSTYYYRVKAVNSTTESPYSNQIMTATSSCCVAPLPPVESAATNISQTYFTANWQARAGATGYSLIVSADQYFGSSVFEGNMGNVTSYQVTGLNCGVTYYYKIRTISSCSTSGLSGLIAVNTLACTANLPNLTLNLNLQNDYSFISNNIISVTNNIINNGDAASAQFKIGYYLWTLDLSQNYFIGNKNLPSVGVGTTIGTNFQIDLCTVGVPNGNYFIGYFVDFENIVNETNENDNNWYNPTQFAINCNVLAAPILTISNIKEDYFSLNWTTIPTATQYYADLSSNPGFNGYIGVIHDYPISASETNINFQDPSNCNQTLYARFRSWNSQNGYSSYSNTVEIKMLRVEPPSEVTGNFLLTSGQSTTLTAVGCTGTAKWYDAPINGNLIYTGHQYIVSPSNSTYYYVGCFKNTCNSLGRNPVSITVNNCSVFQTVKSGNWNDATIWSCGNVPGSNNEATINFGHTIVVPQGIHKVKNFTNNGILELIGTIELNQ